MTLTIEAINLEKRKADSLGVDLLVLIGHYKDECGSDVKSRSGEYGARGARFTALLFSAYLPQIS
jgi:hypothetical protein